MQQKSLYLPLSIMIAALLLSLSFVHLGNMVGSSGERAEFAKLSIFRQIMQEQIEAAQRGPQIRG